MSHFRKKEDNKMNKNELLEYIKARTYHCPYCIRMQTEVKDNGLTAIDNYDGMICGAIEDMKIRLWEVRTGDKWPEHNMDDFFEGDNYA